MSYNKCVIFLEPQSSQKFLMSQLPLKNSNVTTKVFQPLCKTYVQGKSTLKIGKLSLKYQMTSF